MSDRRIPVASILLEASFVVLGVFLALVANDWLADRNARDRAARARQSIIVEVRANREAVASSQAYHSALLDSLRARPASAPPPTPRFFSQGFVHPAKPRSTAWDTATATDAVAAMDYDEVLAFSTLYASQDRYDTSAELAGSVIYNALFEQGAEGVAANARNLSQLIHSFVYMEDGLIEEYDAALDAVDASATGG